MYSACKYKFKAAHDLDYEAVYWQLQTLSKNLFHTCDVRTTTVKEINFKKRSTINLQKNTQKYHQNYLNISNILHLGPKKLEKLHTKNADFDRRQPPFW